nr:unnamed protein product [Callosobruchus chinensis]
MNKVKLTTEQCGKCKGNIAKSQYSISTKNAQANDQFLAYSKRKCGEKWILSKCIEINEGSESEQEEYENCSIRNPSNTNILKAMNRRFADLENAIAFSGEIMEKPKNTIKIITEENKNIKKEQEKLKGRVKIEETNK